MLKPSAEMERSRMLLLSTVPSVDLSDVFLLLICFSAKG